LITSGEKLAATPQGKRQKAKGKNKIAAALPTRRETP